MQVAPRGVVRRLRYTAAAIALALTLFGAEDWTHDAVRDEVGVSAVGREGAEQQRWASLVRWSRAAKTGTLVEGVGPHVGTLRAAAARVALAIEGFGKRGGESRDRVWDGAGRAPWRGTS